LCHARAAQYRLRPMCALSQALCDCGMPFWWMALTLLLAAPVGLAALILLFAGKTTGARITSGAVAALGLLIVTLGLLGRTMGRTVVDRALSGDSVSPEQRERIRGEGYREADRCVSVGLAMGLPTGVAGAGLLAAAMLRRRRD